MPSEPVISCPGCLRQYVIDPTVKLAQCGICKSHFRIAIATLEPPQDATLLSSPIQPHSNFLYEAISHIAESARFIFEKAGEPLSSGSALRFVNNIPRYECFLDVRDMRGYWYDLVERAWHNSSETEKPKVQESVSYFLGHLATRDPYALDMIRQAFEGVLSVEYEKP